jgi:glycosyltransferase involved in cell wall biosynthesis
MLSDYILYNSRSILKRMSLYGFGKSLLKASVYHATADVEAEECKKLVTNWEGFTLPNIVWLPAVPPVRTAHKRFTIVFLSRIHPKKGIELLMEAISRLEEKPLLQIVGAGEGEYIKKLQLKAAALGIVNDIEWMGWQGRDEKFNVLAKADLFALTSYNENFGNSVVESLYAGTPVLITANTALSDFVGQHHLGWICTTTVDDIAIKLRAAMQDVARRNSIAQRAPDIVAAHFSEENLIPCYIMKYQA